MTPFLIYILKVNVLLAVLYLFYKVFLQRESFFNAKRTYFLIGIVGSFVLPFITYTKIKVIDVQLSSNDLTTSDLNVPITSASSINWIEFAYLVSIVCTLLYFFYKVFRLTNYICKLQSYNGAPNIYVDKSVNVAYSFINKIVIPTSLVSAKEKEIVLAHEQIHVKQMHSIDVLLIGVIKQLFWFNPIVYFLQKEIKLNQEYIVDDYITRTSDSYTYQVSLVNFATNHSPEISLVNAFGTSELKKRIIMINQPKSPNMKRLKFLFLTPVIGGFFYLFQVEVKAQYNIVSKDSINVEEVVQQVADQEPKKEKQIISITSKEQNVSANNSKQVLSEQNDQVVKESQKRNKATSKKIAELTEEQQVSIAKRKAELEKERALLEAKLVEQKEQLAKESQKRQEEINKKIEELEAQRQVRISKHKTDMDIRLISPDAKQAEKVGLAKEYNENVKVVFMSKKKGVIDNQIGDGAQLVEMDPKDIKEMRVLNKENAVVKYGEKAKYGAIEVVLK